MSKYQDNERFNLSGERTLVIDGVIVQCIFLDGGGDYEPYTYYNYHIEGPLGEILERDCSVNSAKIDSLIMGN